MTTELMEAPVKFMYSVVEEGDGWAYVVKRDLDELQATILCVKLRLSADPGVRYRVAKMYCC